jgi:hypothetical protein
MQSQHFSALENMHSHLHRLQPAHTCYSTMVWISVSITSADGMCTQYEILHQQYTTTGCSGLQTWNSREGRREVKGRQQQNEGGGIQMKPCHTANQEMSPKHSHYSHCSFLDPGLHKNHFRLFILT